MLPTFLLGVVEVLWEGETVGDLQRLPNHQPHEEPCHQLRTAPFLLTVLDNLQRNLVPLVGGKEGEKEGQMEEVELKEAEAEMEEGRDGGRQGWREAEMEEGRDEGRQG